MRAAYQGRKGRQNNPEQSETSSTLTRPAA